MVQGPECWLWDRFQQCLHNQRDSISDIVGVAFFNVLAIPCFVLEDQEACVEWYWWGGYVAAPFEPLPSQWGARAPSLGGKPFCVSVLQGMMPHPPCLLLRVGSRMQTLPGCPAGPSGMWDEGWDWQSPDLHGDEPGDFWEGGFWVTNCHHVLPPRCRTYGSVSLARLQPRIFYNASWSSLAIPLTPSPQNPAPSKPWWIQHPQKWPAQQKESKYPSQANATALQAPVASLGPDVASIVQLEVTDSGLQGPWRGLKPQGELRT